MVISFIRLIPFDKLIRNLFVSSTLLFTYLGKCCCNLEPVFSLNVKTFVPGDW